MDDLWLTSGQVAQALGCSISSVHRIPHADLAYELVMGKRRRYRLGDVRTYLDVRDTRERNTSSGM